jgi:hypothetical protein
MSHLVGRSLKRSICVAATAAIVGGFGIGAGSSAAATDATSVGSGGQKWGIASHCNDVRLRLSSGATEHHIALEVLTDKEFVFVR